MGEEEKSTNMETPGETPETTQEAWEQKPTNPNAETVQLPIAEIVNRRSRWVSSLAALRYVSSVSQDDEIKVRDTDQATTLALLICSTLAFISLIPGITLLDKHRIPLVLASDLLIGFGLLLYVANRFGIVTTFQPRQALLIWQLMLGCSLLGMFLALNLALIIAEVLRNTQAITLQ